MTFRLSALRELISTVLLESRYPAQDHSTLPQGYEHADENNLMHNEEGMEKSDLENVRKYLRAMGILKA
tara:strand:- start:315 stop:521 length:207 start_codon:yes stop_codon:yes gene_type:complete